MRAMILLAAIAAALSTGCYSAHTVDAYTGVDLKTSPGESAVREAYMDAREMTRSARGNYKEPHWSAFSGLKYAQERWLREPVAGGPMRGRIEDWVAKYKFLARQIHGNCMASGQRRKMLKLDLELAVKGVDPLLEDTQLQLIRMKQTK